ncbi:hypothetical protein ACL9RL_19045 [Plantibacter sp. Mn2098]|uniref:hypothetical protein n=1 Tax=Plantibacter sp. Mn2098 TaxID=3395266 RepID=UPI003BBDAAC6
MTTPAPQDPQYQQPQQYAAAPADFPGKTLGLVGLILSILLPLVGLILSLVANSQSKKAGFPNQLAKVGIIIGAILTALGIIGAIFWGIAAAALISNGVTTTY